MCDDFRLFSSRNFREIAIIPDSGGNIPIFSHPFSLLSFFGKGEKVSIREKNSGLLLETLPDNFQTITRTISRNGERGRKRPFFTFYVSFYARLHARASSFGSLSRSKGVFAINHQKRGK